MLKVILALLLFVVYVVVARKFDKSDSDSETERKSDAMASKENHNTNTASTGSNKLAVIIGVIAIIVIVCGFILGCVLANEFEWVVGIGVIVVSIISGIFMLGFAEVIQLLQNIKDKK